MSRISWATAVYIGAVVVAAAVIVSEIRTTTLSPGFWVVCGSLALLFLLCDATSAVLGDRQWAWSPSSAATLAAVVLLGAQGGLGAALVGSVAVISIRPNVPMVERLFNGAMYAIA